MSEGYRTYRDITTMTLEYAIKKFDVNLNEDQKKRLMEIWVSFKAWPEAKEVIDEIKTVVINSHQVVITSSLITELMKKKVKIELNKNLKI